MNLVDKRRQNISDKLEFFGLDQNIETSNRYDYESHPVGDVQKLTSIVFAVKTKSDAHVGLNFGEKDRWEIVLGGWNNTRSCIRLAMQKDEIISANHCPLSNERFKSFWISWIDQSVQVGQGPQVGENMFM